MSAAVDEQADRRTPRFVFLTDDDTLGPDSRYAWRLDAANHRPLGRSAAISVGLEACRAAAAAVHRAIAAAEVRVERLGSHWAWRVALDSSSAVSLHPYLRRVECLRGFAQFAEVVGATDPARGVVRSFGEHTLRAFDVTKPLTGSEPRA